jgi:hypothetical protein
MIELKQGPSSFYGEKDGLMGDARRSSIGMAFKAVYGRDLQTVREYDYWRNESIGRSLEELQQIMEAEKTEGI